MVQVSHAVLACKHFVHIGNNGSQLHGGLVQIFGGTVDLSLLHGLEFLQEAATDLVYKVNTKSGSIYLFFLFELQSYNDFTMPFRLLVYMTAIWLDYFKNSDKNMRKQKEYRLPAIMPIVQIGRAHV